MSPPTKLTPACPEQDFMRRVMRRFRLNFVIVGEQVADDGSGNGIEWRDATEPEISMWDLMIPSEIREQLNNLYKGRDLDLELVLDPTYQELEQILDCYGSDTLSSRKPYVYLSAEDFCFLRKGSLDHEELNLSTSRDLLRTGLVATYHGAQVYVSRWIPRGYYYLAAQPDPVLCWQPTSDKRELCPIPKDFDYDLKPLERLFG